MKFLSIATATVFAIIAASGSCAAVAQTLVKPPTISEPVVKRIDGAVQDPASLLGFRRV